MTKIFTGVTVDDMMHVPDQSTTQNTKRQHQVPPVVRCLKRAPLSPRSGTFSVHQRLVELFGERS